ncbi:hypothetical protein LXT12_17555 [Pelomonas sp. P7]|uniref:Secreted protein n=1 Tax=Pelomonas caseinilytica TaxID=2906763 RepID=A0ABS8XH79_9BURK|nr:hypothetical protein [Pelomonas sp. P7]MCE4539060.1 hypothetical protein [Pelomonas sp. P7]
MALALSLLTTASSAEPGTPIMYRTASYAIARSTQSSAELSNVEWAYPVMVGSKLGQFDRVNAWLRKKSVELLAECVSSRIDELLKLPDRKIVTFLARNSNFSACETNQSIVEPAEAFGQYITFRRISEWRGLARPQHDIQLLVFDLQSNVELTMASLFKPGALDALNEALAEVIQSTKPNCSGRNFVWSQVSLRPPHHLFIEFPYNPAEWEACGDGVEALEGQAVSSQLRNPASLQPLRPLMEAR